LLPCNLILVVQQFGYESLKFRLFVEGNIATCNMFESYNFLHQEYNALLSKLTKHQHLCFKQRCSRNEAWSWRNALD